MVANERETDAPAVVCVVVKFMVPDLGVTEDAVTVAEADIACCSLVTRILFLPVD